MTTSITTMSEGFSTNPSGAQNSEAIARNNRFGSHYPPDARKRIKLEGLFLACVPLLGAPVIAILLLDDLTGDDIIKPILICALGGITGSWMYAVRVYVHAVTHGRWRRDELVERLTTPFTGIFLAVSAYTLIKTGIMGVSFTTNTPNTPRSDTDTALYCYAIGFLVGLFSEDVMGKLTGVVKTLFGKPADDGGDDGGKEEEKKEEIAVSTGNKSKNAEDKASVSSFRTTRRARGAHHFAPPLRTARRAPLNPVVPVSS